MKLLYAPALGMDAESPQPSGRGLAANSPALRLLALAHAHG